MSILEVSGRLKTVRLLSRFVVTPQHGPASDQAQAERPDQFRIQSQAMDLAEDERGQRHRDDEAIDGGMCVSRHPAAHAEQHSRDRADEQHDEIGHDQLPGWRAAGMYEQS